MSAINLGKKESRLRRAKKTRMKIRELCIPHITIHRTSRHIYAQLLNEDGSRVLAAASTLQPAIRTKEKFTGNVDAAKAVGKLLAERALAAGVKKVAFDRSGFKYHGRVKALAEAAREGGLEF